MKIPCEKITDHFKKYLIKRVKGLKKRKITSKLVTILVGESPEQLSFVAIKKRVAKELGIGFQLLHLEKIPEFARFIGLLKEVSSDKNTSGIIIQQPLPSRLYTETIYTYISPMKEIEGHQKKSVFLPPIGLAVLTVIKYIFSNQKISDDVIIDPKKDTPFLRNILKNKRIVLAGHGTTGGLPIGKTLSFFKLNYLNTNSQTENASQYYQEADIIITAVGKKILDPQKLKPGVILVNVGLRREDGKLKGDYDEGAIKTTAGHYTTTPKGVGPIDVMYLYKNLIDATERQYGVLK